VSIAPSTTRLKDPAIKLYAKAPGALAMFAADPPRRAFGTSKQKFVLKSHCYIERIVIATASSLLISTIEIK